ncbi:MAG TPA: hypothetical protein VFA60_11580 [Terriglobales bacterium]|nr:hypothetical protein [Terriglobales bacterium]
MDMGIDIRLPIGMLFTALGGILVVFGALSDSALYQRSLGINVNLGWGAVLLAFGIVMLVLGRAAGAPRPHSTTPKPGPAGTPRAGEQTRATGSN